MKRPDSGFSPDALARSLFAGLRLSSQAPLKIAYSGGMDSHVLLHALAALRAQSSLRLSAIHVDHGLLPASRDWAGHCEAVCAQLGVPYHLERVRVDVSGGEGVEAAARRARYAALARHVAGGEVLLTAHHQDDQAETVLLQLLRGTGMHGLAGMPGLAAFSAGQHARPLLGFSRAALQSYAEARGLRWVEDPSNEDVGFRRNQLRHEVFPVLNRHWPGAAESLARTARHAGDCMQLLDDLGAADLAVCLSGPAGQALSIPAVVALPPARQRNLLRYWLRARGFLAPSAAHLEEVVGRLGAPTRSRHACFAWPGTEIHRYRDELHAMPPLGPVDAQMDIVWSLSGTLALPGLGMVLRAVPVTGRGLSLARLAGKDIHVRLRQGGETCRLPGRTHHHKLKKLLQEEGVVPWLRNRLPLLFVGHELAAVGDQWVCEPFVAHADEPGMQLELIRPQEMD